MNVLLIATNLEHVNGGVCTHVLDLCREYTSKHNFNVVLVADGTDYLDAINAIKGVKYIELPLKKAQGNPIQFVSCTNRLKNICKENSIDIIHLHSQRAIPMAWFIKLSLGIPFVWTNHIDAIPMPSALKLFQKVMRFPVISVSPELKEQLVNDLGFDEKNITVVCNGIVLEQYTPLTEDERKALQDKFNVSDDDFVISEVARICPVKGQDKLVRAIDDVQKELPGVHIKLLLAGTGELDWLQTEVLDYANAHGVDCQYIGFQKPREIFGISNLSVLYSSFEGFSLACVESLAMSCPVIRSDSPGWKVMQDIAYMVPKNNPETLVSSIVFIIQNYSEAKEKAYKGRNRCEMEFNTVVESRKTIDVYERTILRK